ncbi:methyltransferase domain-containing protein [Yinghuangia sp. YIM S09857]|uniref:methyltransferase domain-containing protein n=1 Tax=Yinghuangia sp. YIM S09857 TaxID=3436929 RepID=UPI003F53433F
MRGEGGTHEPCDRRDEPQRWDAAAWADRPVVVQVCDGDDGDADDVPPWPSSSASQPSVVASMLLDLDVADGMRVLEIGTGSGWNAGLLAHRLGDANVVTVEVDQALAATARTRLAAIGLAPLVVTVDGAEGFAQRAPHDRVLATCSVVRIPLPWVRQVRVGGRIVAPWATGWTHYGTVRLRVRPDGSASGRFRAGGSFMPMRSQRSQVDSVADVLGDDKPDSSRTTLSPWEVAGRADSEADFAIGLRTSDLWHHWEDQPEDGVSTRLWVGDEAGSSWAAVDYDGRQLDTFAVRQNGPRRVWDEVEDAWDWWTSAGSPLPERFGLAVGTDGSHRVWLDEEGSEDAWYVRHPA